MKGLLAQTPRGTRALLLPRLKKPLSGWTEAEQQFRLSQLKSLKMPGAIHGQPPAKGTLGFVVYFPDSGYFFFSSHLLSLPFNLAFILPLPSQHADFLVTSLPHVRLQYPEVSSSCPRAARAPAVSFGLQFPEVLWGTASLSPFQDHNSRRLQLLDSCLFTRSRLELAGFQPASRRTVTT